LSFSVEDIACFQKRVVCGLQPANNPFFDNTQDGAGAKNAQPLADILIRIDAIDQLLKGLLPVYQEALSRLFRGQRVQC